MRTTISLTDEQVRDLAVYCAEDRISRAEAVRRAIDLYLARRLPLVTRNTKDFPVDDAGVHLPYRL